MMKNRIQLLFYTFASVFLLASCSGGAIGDGTSPVLTSPTSVAVVGSDCLAAESRVVAIYGGDPPYTLSNTIPKYATVSRSIINYAGESFRITFQNGCASGSILILDAVGKSYILNVSNSTQ